jgi:cephalosporin-C deacetylase-like acetyl esterase
MIRIALLSTMLLAFAAFAEDTYDQLLSHFNYDRNAPLDVQQTGVQERDGVKILDISYASPKGGRVPAYLIVPGQKGPFAGIIWGHWYARNSAMGNRKEFLDEAVVLAHSGAVSVLTDGPIARAGYRDDRTPLSDTIAEYRLQQILDMRRAADLLLARTDVDPKRIGYVGHSYNATVGGYLSGIDRRFKALVLMAGNLSDEIDIRTKEYQDYRAQVGPEKFDAYVAKWAWLDPGKYVSHAAPAVVFLQFARQESFLTPERVKEYYARVSDPKQMKIYDVPHALDAEARRDRAAFLQKQLRLKAIDMAMLAKVPELVQPPEPNR